MVVCDAMQLQTQTEDLGKGKKRSILQLRLISMVLEGRVIVVAILIIALFLSFLIPPKHSQRK